MKRQKLLQLYAIGRRDFRGERFRGQSFRGQNLAGIDLSQADIRGTDFTEANLTEANLTKAEAGLPPLWRFFWGLIACLLAAATGFLAGYAGYIVALMLETEAIGNRYAGWGILSFLLLFFVLTMGQGLGHGTRWAAGTVAVSIALTIAAAFMLAVLGTVQSIFPEALVIVLSFAITTALAVAVTFSVSVAMAIASNLIRVLGVVIVVMVAFLFSVVSTFAVAIAITVTASIPVASLIGSLITALSTVIGWQTVTGSPKQSFMRTVAFSITTIGGTRFRKANLTDTDFTQAHLKSTDLRQATLLRTRWLGAKQLDRARPGNSYLHHPIVRELVVTGQGQNLTFQQHRPNLNGINLAGANLTNADFTGITLKDSTLEGANLTQAIFTVANLNRANLRNTQCFRTKLVQTQLHRANLTGACLTGATIEDWGITTATQLSQIRCDYVFMHWPTEESSDRNPHRKPDDWDTTFAPGEFIDFITPMVETLDLYHHQTVDPRAVAIAFNELRESHPQHPLDIISLERRGQNRDHLLLRAESSPQANLSALHAQYFERYHELLALPPQTLAAILMEKESQASLLASLVGTAVNRPGIYAKTFQNQGEQMSNPPNVNQTFHGPVTGVAGNVQGDQPITATGQPLPLAAAAAQIQQLLQQLAKTNPTVTTGAQKTVLTAAIPHSVKQRLISAVKAGGKTAIEEVFDNAYVNVVMSLIEGWQEINP